MNILLTYFESYNYFISRYNVHKFEKPTVILMPDGYLEITTRND